MFYFTKNIKEEIGKNLKKARKKKNLRQIDVADSASINESYYSKVEQGTANISMEKFYKIVKALGVKSEEVLPF